MALSLRVSVDGALKRIQTCAIATSDLQKPLAIIGGHLRKNARARYEAQAFTPLADATIKARAARGLRKLEVKLEGDLRKANARAQRARTPRGLMAIVLGSSDTKRELQKATRGQTNRRAVLAEYQRLAVKRVSAQRREGGFARIVGAERLSVKQRLSLGKRMGRAVAKAIDGPILGKWPNTYHLEVDGDSVTFGAFTGDHWTETQNKGGPAGHGAKIPERLTIELTQADLDFALSVLKDHCLDPLLEEIPA